MNPFALPLLACVASCCLAAELVPAPSYMTDEEAAEAHPGFPLVGDYLSLDGTTALQANLLPDGCFLVAIYAGGLPGEGWDKTPVRSSVKTAGELGAILEGYRKIGRASPSLGLAPPANAILVFPDDFTNVKEGLLMAGGRTKKDLGSFRMHLEFLIPFKPGRNLSSQDRGNSGIYIFNNYEIQVIDSFGLDLCETNNAIETESRNTQWCGALYKTKTPDVHMAFPPLCWQTYDIEFTAPVFVGEHKCQNARITVRHNGVPIHDNVELASGTGNGAMNKQLASGPVYFQNHGNPVMYRNVWAAPLE